MNKASLRLARLSDAPAILEVFAPYVKETAISFEYEVPSLEDYTEKIRTVSAVYPFLVCEIGGGVIGFSYAARHMARAAYAWNAELSVYVNREYCGMGIGHAFYAAIIDILKLQNVQNVYGGVTIPNESSEWLHKSMGFEVLGIYRKTGFKLGKWHDVAWFEKHIGNHITPPRKVVPITQLNPAEVDAILEQNSRIIR